MDNFKSRQVPNGPINLGRSMKRVLTIFSMVFLAHSCNKTTPAGFWINFHKEFVVAKNSDQGPWGGHREIKWEREDNNSFTDGELINFADKNDWKLIDSMSFSSDSITTNRFANLGNDDYSLDILNEHILPKLKRDDSKIFIFKTTWLKVEPGNTRETYENGFAVLNTDKTALTVFHFWGE